MMRANTMTELAEDAIAKKLRKLEENSDTRSLDPWSGIAR
jgi:hypothetical protein